MLVVRWNIMFDNKFVKERITGGWKQCRYGYFPASHVSFCPCSTPTQPCFTCPHYPQYTVINLNLAVAQLSKSVCTSKIKMQVKYTKGWDIYKFHIFKVHTYLNGLEYTYLHILCRSYLAEVRTNNYIKTRMLFGIMLGYTKVYMPSYTKGSYT